LDELNDTVFFVASNCMGRITLSLRVSVGNCNSVRGSLEHVHVVYVISKYDEFMIL